MNTDLFVDDTITHSTVKVFPLKGHLEITTFLGHIPLRRVSHPLPPDPEHNANLHVTIYRNMVKVKQNELHPPHLQDVKRGVCSLEFSGKKRKRCIDCFNQWRMPMRNMVMVHLTYPNEYPLDWHIWKMHLKQFKYLLQRRFPHCQGVWKLELQRRGAPHYHMLIDLMQLCRIERFRDWLDAAWARIAHQDDIYGGRFACRAEIVFSVRHAQNYAAKYCGKYQPAPIDDKGQVMTSAGMRDTMGRHWGKIGKLDCSPSEELSLPATSKTFMRIHAAMELARRGARGWVGLLNPHHHGSFSVYGIGDKPADGLEKAGELIANWEKLYFDADDPYKTCFAIDMALGG